MDMSILFWSRSDTVSCTNLMAFGMDRSMRMCLRHVSITTEHSAQLSRRTVSMPFVSSLSNFSGFDQYSPAYRFLFIRRYG